MSPPSPESQPDSTYAGSGKQIHQRHTPLSFLVALIFAVVVTTTNIKKEIQGANTHQALPVGCRYLYPINIHHKNKYAPTEHIVLDGINKSKCLDWSNDPSSSCWLIDWENNMDGTTEQMCKDVSTKIEIALNQIQLNESTSNMNMFIFHYNDNHKFPCEPLSNQTINKNMLLYGKRSMAISRGNFQDGTRATYDSYEQQSRGAVAWLPFAVRTDEVLEIIRQTTTYQKNQSSTTGTFDIREGPIVYLPRIQRNIDVQAFFDIDKTKKPANFTKTEMRSQVGYHLLEMAEANPTLKIKVGKVGQNGRLGRLSIQPEYVASILSSKIVVTCQPGEWEGHWRFFEAMAGGAMVMTDPSIHIPEGYVDGENVVVFRSLSDLESKILYYLSHESQRSEIASKGWELALTRHRSWNRMEDFILQDSDKSKCQ